ncbi:uncharacterized protein [Asterias amurensis]|uniref:uncharacterized protein isoform X2 n=1 Tax=Asterias amurensis TaxID=7602 RepID=UPI003AB750D0
MANQDLKATIQRQNNEFMKRYDADDMTGLKNLFTKDCTIWVGGSDHKLYGKDDVPRLLGQARAGGATYKRITDEVGPPGPDGTVYERGHYLTIGADGAELASGYYLSIWKNIDGEFKLHVTHI